MQFPDRIPSRRETTRRGHSKTFGFVGSLDRGWGFQPQQLKNTCRTAAGSPRHLITRVRLVLYIALVVVSVLSAMNSRAGEVLYNGIELPDEWPPNRKALPEQLPTPSYLVAPPEVISIDVGRQLFVDDFLIERTDMTRQFHRAVYHPANPVLTFDQPWEMSKAQGGLPTASPYSGGVWYDPGRRKFLMWYMGGYIEHLCLAESDDGVNWVKPKLDVKSDTNVVLWKGATESNSLLMDLNERDPARRFKYFMTNIGRGWKTEYRHSADGIHWSEPEWYSGPHGDRTTVSYNPFRKRWVFALRTSDRSGLRQGRAKKYWETSDINDESSVQWPADDSGQFEAAAPLWVSADRGLDKPRVEVGISPQLYHLDCVAYESLMLGMFSILRGDFHENDGEGRDAYPGRPKCAEICLGYTRDGFNWHRPTHDTFAGISDTPGDWNWGNVQSTGNSFVVVGDYLYFYVSGRKGAGGNTAADTELLHPAYAGCSTGLAVLRRDGFVSMDALEGSTDNPARRLKTLTTRKMQFSGSHLFVNVDAAQGELRVEVLDENENVISPFTKERCRSVQSNKTLQAITWDGANDLSQLSGQPVRFRFHLTNGSLYSFWVSPGTSGASQGYVAGGGPGFTAHHDAVGIGSYASQPATYKPLVIAKRPSTETPRDSAIPPQRELVMWLKADSVEGVANGELVTRWNDSSGNGMACEQKDEAKRPHWIKNAIGGAPALRFDGTDDHLFLDHYPGLFHTYYQSTIFAVAQPRNGGTLLSQAHANLTILTGQTNRLVYSSSFATTDGTQSWPQLQSERSGSLAPHRSVICSIVRTGDNRGETSLRINGSRVDDGTAFPYHTTSPIAAFVGCAYQKRSPWDGDIAEIIVYGRALADTEREAVEGYLSEKYRIEK